MSTPFKYVLVALTVLVGASGLTLLQLENRRRQRGVAALAGRARECARLREDNARLARLLAGQRQDADSARARVQRDLADIRTEIASLEQEAEQRHAARAALIARDTTALQENRDPRQGPARLEHFENRGRATPAAALETLAWAALTGHDAALAEVTALNSATRARAEAFLLTLPAEERARWTPERLGQLWFQGLFTEIPALQILGETIVAADEAVVRLRFPLRAGEEKLALRLTPVGWKVLVPGAAIDQLQQKLQPAR